MVAPPDFSNALDTRNFGENFMKKSVQNFEKLSTFKGQFYVHSIFEAFIMEWDYIL